MNIVICGFGRAAKALTERVLQSEENKLIAVLGRKESKNIGKDIGEILYGKGIKLDINVISFDSAVEMLKNEKIDVVIDFSNREMAFPLIKLCGELKTNLVICTTNHTAEEIGKFQAMANDLNIGVVYAPNLTIGINLLMEFVNKLGKVLADFDFEIIEKHPKDKAQITATARMISQSINKTNTPIHSVRLNGFVGVHEVIATDGIEKITIEHESFSRLAFAKGALAAANFIENKTGLYFMSDVIKSIEENN